MQGTPWMQLLSHSLLTLWVPPASSSVFYSGTLCPSSFPSLQERESLQVLVPPEAGGKEGWHGSRGRARPQRMGILVVLSFYLQLLIYTVTILLSYRSISLKQQPQSLAVIENLNCFLQLAKPAKRNALSLIVIFCTFLVRGLSTLL